MKNSSLTFAFLFFSFISLAQNWPALTIDSKPGSRWWWFGNAVDSNNITINMQEYAKAGLGSLEITPIYGVVDNEINELSFLSPQWMQMLKHSQNEGKRLGIHIDMNTGTGWPFGGPEVTINDAASKAIFQKYMIVGGDEINLNIELVDKKQKNTLAPTLVMAYSSNGLKLNLTSHVIEKSLLWTPPSGDWTIIVLYIGKTMQNVKRAAPGGVGLVVNHFDKNAIKRYLSRFDSSFISNSASFPSSFFCDSYEVYNADWSPDFLDEFASRRGYKLEYFFPEFLDENRSDITSRIISDYRETIAELLLDNFTLQWTHWAHKHGSKTRNQENRKQTYYTYDNLSFHND